MLGRTGGTHALKSRFVIFAVMLAVMTEVVVSLPVHRLAPSLVDISGGGARECTKRGGERALFAMRAENIVVVGLPGNLVDGIWLVGASRRSSSRRKCLGVKSIDTGFVLWDVSIYLELDRRSSKHTHFSSLPVSRGGSGWKGPWPTASAV